MKKTLTIGLIGLMILVLASVLLALNLYRQALDQSLTNGIYTRLTELSSSNASKVNLKFHDQLQMLDTLATYMVQENLHSSRVNDLLNTAVETYGFTRCAITFPDGSFITHDHKKAGNVSLKPYFIQGMQGISSIAGPMPAIVDPAKQVVLLTVPMQQENKVVAILSATYETKNLDSIFKVKIFDNKGYSYITDAQGNIISMPQHDATLVVGTNILDSFRSLTPKKNDVTAISQDMDKLQSGTFLLITEENKVYVSYQPLGLNDWYIFSVVSGDVLEAQRQGILRNVYFLSLVIVLAFFIVLAAISYYIHAIQQKAKKELQRLAYYDPLTGLANCHLFTKQAREILDTVPGPYAYIILNVNRFKIINEIFGFAQGDALLQHIATILGQEQRKNECCARFEADSFHILASYPNKPELEERISRVVQQITAFSFKTNMKHSLSVGFGVYEIQDKSMSIDEMGNKARMALAKIKGLLTVNSYFYHDDIINQIMDEQDIENCMQNALDNGEFTLYLQPKYHATQGCIVGAEALVRWIHPEKGLITPDRFISLFEKNGFITLLDQYMLETACQKLQEWQKKGMPVVPISVNQSRRCLYQPDYLAKLTAIAKTYAINPAQIELEITESAFFEDEGTLIDIISQLHDLGFHVAMDDFGTGYSSLHMLQEMLVDVLKLDKTFFKESIHSQRGKIIVQHIVTMAQHLYIQVVAEGIETKEQVAFLQSIHCHIAQGFYFSKPVPVQVFEEMLKKDKAQQS